MSRLDPPLSVSVRAPMKLVLAGEYAVLEPGAPGIVAAVDRYVTCTARASGNGVTIVAATLGGASAHAPLPDRSGSLLLESSSGDIRRFAFAQLAAELAYGYVTELGILARPLEITCESAGAHAPAGDQAPGGPPAPKLGLGASAATTVAILGAVMSIHGIPIDRPTFKRQLFRLALVAHARAQGGRGSGIDVAASAHGGLVDYGRAEASWLRRVDRTASALELARGPWPGLHVEPLPLPAGMHLLAGFTGASASTVDLVSRVEVWKRDRPGEHESFARRSQRAVRGLATALRRGDRQDIVTQVGEAREALAYLAARTGLEIETPALARLAKIAFDAGGAGKLSGAGGGDCGLGIAFDEATARAIEDGWRAEGILPVPIGVAPMGIAEMREETAR